MALCMCHDILISARLVFLFVGSGVVVLRLLHIRLVPTAIYLCFLLSIVPPCGSRWLPRVPVKHTLRAMILRQRHPAGDCIGEQPLLQIRERLP